MPNNAGKKISRIFGSCVFLLLSAQIVIGCAWGILNFTSFQEFPESAKMILLSSGLALKSDTSVIYPALLLIVRTLTLNGPIRFYEVMYSLQLVLAFAAWHTFAVKLLPFEKKWLRIWFALAVVTNPFAMQCHLAVVEFSFVSSFLCLLVTFTVRFSLEWRMIGNRLGLKTAVKHICTASLFWMLVSLTRKEFVFIGFFCILLLLYRICINLKAGTKLSRLSPAIVFIVFFAAIELIDGAFRVSKPLLPSDIIGTQILNYTTNTFDTKLGPVHANFVLLDEINRSSAKTQSAMLEVMQEHQTTIGGENYPVPEIFMVIATQNPIEQEGTYVLSEAQLDRFAIKEKLDYPTEDEEITILNRVEADVFSKGAAVVGLDSVKYLQDLVKKVYIDESVKRYIIKLVNATRHPKGILPETLTQYMTIGSSTRGAICLMEVSKAVALLNGRDYVTPDDVKAEIHSVLRHRVTLNFAAVADGVDEDMIIDAIMGAVPAP